MATITINKQFADGLILTEAQLDAAFDSVAGFINNGLIGSDNIEDNSIGAAELQTSSVTETKIATDAVTTSKILDANVTLSKLAAAVRELLTPTATVHIYAGNPGIPPAGYLYCDGQAVSRTTYATLFGLLGTSHGNGNGTTTFNVPDYRGRFLRGLSDGTGRDPNAATRTAMNTGGATGDAVGSIQADALRAHNHGIVASSSTSSASDNDTYQNGQAPQNAKFTSTTGGNETRPLNANVGYIIKT